MGCETLYIKKIENGIRGIRMGTKSPYELMLLRWFAKLEPLNQGLHDDLLEKYKKVLKHFNQKKNGKSSKVSGDYINN